MLNLDYLGNNFFLKKLFPTGIINNIFIKDFSVSINGNSEFSFFIQQKPFIDIKKWGKWQNDFNCIWVKTSNHIRYHEITIKNLHKLGFHELSFESNNSCIQISSKNQYAEFFLLLREHDRFIIQEILPITI